MIYRKSMAWGSAAMLLAALAASAQPSTERTRQAPKPPSDRQSAALASVLNDMEGLWSVHVIVNPELWNKKGKDDRSTSPGNARRPENARPGEEPQENPQDRLPETPRTDQPELRTNQPGTDGGTSRHVEMQGFAERKLILGTQVLQEMCFIPDMEKNLSGEREAGEDQSPRINEGTHQSMSLLSFDGSDGTYTAVFVDGTSGVIHHRRGTYDANAQRIVFRGDRSMESPDRTPHRDGGERPARTGVPEGWNDRTQDSSNVQVVVDLMGPNQHRVTMYRFDRDMPMTPRPGEPTGQEPGNPDHRSDPTRHQPQGVEPATLESWDPATLASSMVYQATYTRAEGSQAAQYRDLVREAQVSSATNSDR